MKRKIRRPIAQTAAAFLLCAAMLSACGGAADSPSATAAPEPTPAATAATPEAAETAVTGEAAARAYAQAKTYLDEMNALGTKAYECYRDGALNSTVYSDGVSLYTATETGGDNLYTNGNRYVREAGAPSGSLVGAVETPTAMLDGSVLLPDEAYYTGYGAVVEQSDSTLRLAMTQEGRAAYTQDTTAALQEQLDNWTPDESLTDEMNDAMKQMLEASVAEAEQTTLERWELVFTLQDGTPVAVEMRQEVRGPDGAVTATTAACKQLPLTADEIAKVMGDAAAEMGAQG